MELRYPGSEYARLIWPPGPDPGQGGGDERGQAGQPEQFRAIRLAANADGAQE
jgi:hypothetical protein